MIWFAPLLSCLSLLFSIASKAKQPGRVIHKYLLANDRVGCPNRELVEGGFWSSALTVRRVVVEASRSYPTNVPSPNLSSFPFRFRQSWCG